MLPFAPAAEGFVYQNTATRVILRSGAIGDLAKEASALGCRRLMLICGPRTRAGGVFARVRATLGTLAVTIFDRVVEHSSTRIVMEAARLARDARIDGLVAIGGGSASDTAKGIAIVLAEGEPIERHASRFEPPDRFFPTELPHPKLPVIAVPTTASAAEVTPGLGIRNDEGKKLLFWDVKLACRLIVLDPEANTEVPAAVMASTGMNGFAHCAEGLYSRLRNPISDAIALHGIRLFSAALPAMVREPGSVEHRAKALTAAHLSGMVISNARVGIHHATCHCLGARGGLAHGVANSVMLPHALAYNREAAAPALAAIAEAMGSDDAIEAVRRLQKESAVPSRLRDTGLDRALLPAIAEDTLHDRGLYFNPRRTESARPILQMLEQAW